jgi:hypothetical protein
MRESADQENLLSAIHGTGASRRDLDAARAETAELRKTLATVSEERDAFNLEARGYLTKLGAALALLDRAEKALEPFAKMADQIDEWERGTTSSLPIAHEGDLRLARSTLEDVRKGKG